MIILKLFSHLSTLKNSHSVFSSNIYVVVIIRDYFDNERIIMKYLSDIFLGLPFFEILKQTFEEIYYF